MEFCRCCKFAQPLENFVVRGKNTVTKTCITCSEHRKDKDYCLHGTREHDCKKCSDPIVRRATAMVHSSRISDKKKNRYCDLDFKFTINAVCQTPNCHYCDVPLQYERPYEKDFCTIDRINNDLGHLKDNCVISCRQCNCYNYKFLSPKWITFSAPSIVA
jgi:hypothetical protein